LTGMAKKNEKQPWTEPLPDDNYNDICEGCRNDTNCRSKVTFNIDLQSLLEGQSSAKGGPTYQKDDDEEAGARLVGVPVEFDNICEAMKYFSKRENLNINTQVIGFGHKQKRVLLPLQGEQCLWTEWFDFESPCRSTGDKEHHLDAKTTMLEQESGPLRICEEESVMKTEYAGGSELRIVDSNDAKGGKAIGHEGINFKQNIETELGSKLTCLNSENMEMNQTVPAPYAYPPDFNTTCLDYKARYCCKSTDMYRPTDLDDFSQYLKYIFPIGATRIDLNLAEQKISKATMKILSCVGAKTSTEAKIIFENDNQVTIKLKKGQGASGKIVSMEGTYKIDEQKGTSKNIYTIDYVGGNIVLEIKLIGKKDAVVEKCTINSDVTNAKAVVEFYPGDTATPTIITNRKKTIAAPTQIWTTTITSEVNGHEENYEVKIDNDGNVLNTTGQTPTYLAKVDKMWKKISQLNAELNFDYFIESPPLALLFAECDWKDYINKNYPEKDGKSQNYEFELKKTAYRGNMTKHVCGNTIGNSHFIDAVTVEDQIPWYEVKLKNGEKHETLKLTPYYGYACYDGNQAGDGLCQDMKVRYCCAKQHRASWGEWEKWSKCSKSCDGGQQTRTRTCVRSADVDEHGTRCFGQDSNEVEYYRQQKKECNVVGCPTDFMFTAWSSWTSCSESCGKGFKTRDRRCDDGKNGGESCPDIFDKKTNAKSMEYEQREYCTKADCIVPQWSHWSAWSSCSMSCGKGIEERTRGCRTSRTFEKLPQDSCGSAKDAKSERKCKVKDCPIDGKWGKWSDYSACNQNCIYDVDSNEHGAEQYNSKAYRERKRYCVDPIPKFGGNGCKISGTKKVVRDQPEIEKKKCSVGEDPSLKYCAENCVYSSWSEWTLCSQSCMTADFEYHKNDDDEDNDLKNPKVLTNEPPFRDRTRNLLKKEKHGGSCHRSSHFKSNDEGLGYDYERVPCPCCQYTNRHGNISYHNKGEVYRENKLIPYDENKECVPMCPYSCEWGGWKSNYDCEDPEDVMRTIEEWGLRWTFNETKNCYDVPIAELFEDYYLKDWKTFVDSVYDKENWNIDGEHINPDFMSLDSRVRRRMLALAPEIKRQGGVRRPRRRRGRTGKKWEDFVKDYSGLTSLQWIRFPRGKIIDPVFGGTNCYKYYDGHNYTLTRIREEDPQAEGWNRGEIMTNPRKFYEEKYEVGVCTLPLCTPTFRKFPDQPVQRCGRHMWTRWGEWGQCDKNCGLNGERKRKRKCTECGDPMGEHNPAPGKGDCNATTTFDGSEGLKDTDTAQCSPCPSDSLVGWADWGEWSTPDKVECGTTAKQYRARKCNDDYRAALEDEGDQKTCEGVQSQSRDLKNKCEQ